MKSIEEKCRKLTKPFCGGRQEFPFKKIAPMTSLGFKRVTPRVAEALEEGTRPAAFQDKLLRAQPPALPLIFRDGRGRQGQRDQARDVGRQPAGMPGDVLQGAERRGTDHDYPGAAFTPAQRAAIPASSTAVIMKTLVCGHPELLSAASAGRIATA